MDTEHEQLLLPPGRSPFHTLIYIVVSAIVALIAVAIFIFVASKPPAEFIAGTVVHVPKNATISDVAKSLRESSLIKSEDLFKAASLIVGGKGGAFSGDYQFDAPTDVWTIADRITHGAQGLARVKVTLPEGLTTAEMSGVLGSSITGFDTTGFISLASSSEGYLFPDTYYFFTNVQPVNVIQVLRDEFDQKYASLRSDPQISALFSTGAMYGKTKADIVTMASIIEKEASTPADREIVSGILWKRLSKGMLLQVDAPFLYLLGKTSDELTVDDLKMKSPYNTYIHTGLPPGPIANPGLDALHAAMMPTSTAYWFYLSDKKGVMHYAKTYDEHLENREKYLGK
jgi:UPF0755 protein